MLLLACGNGKANSQLDVRDSAAERAEAPDAGGPESATLDAGLSPVDASEMADGPMSLDGPAVTDAPLVVDAADVPSTTADAGCPVIVGPEPQPAPVDAATWSVPLGATRDLVQVIATGPWRPHDYRRGIAVDRQKRVFMLDHDQIHMVHGSTVTSYLTAAEIRDAIAVPLGVAELSDIDIGPDGQLYVLGWNALLKSSAPHQVSLWHQFPDVWLGRRLAVLGDNDVLFTLRGSYVGGVSYGMLRASHCGLQTLYSKEQVFGSEECGNEDLAVAPAGKFLYAPGCRANPLLQGHANGRGVGLLYPSDHGMNAGPLNATDFACLAHDRAGGFYVMVAHWDKRDVRLYHLAQDAAGDRGVVAIPTVPSLTAAGLPNTEDYGFPPCSMAVAHDKSIFLRVRSQLWTISPPP